MSENIWDKRSEMLPGFLLPRLAHIASFPGSVSARTPSPWSWEAIIFPWLPHDFRTLSLILARAQRTLQIGLFMQQENQQAHFQKELHVINSY